MTDSIDTIDAKADSGDIEDQVQSWLNSNAGGVTSVDDIEYVRIGPNRVVAAIHYTA